MTVVEQRKQQRHVLGRQASGKFRLLTPEAQYPITAIRDISGSGIRVFLDACLAERLDVVVEYTELTLKLEMNGRVAWCTEQTDGTETQTHGTETVNGDGRYVVGMSCSVHSFSCRWPVFTDGVLGSRNRPARAHWACEVGAEDSE